MQQSMQISLLCSTEHKEENMIFINSPFEILDEAFPDGRHRTNMERRVVRIREWFERLERFENYRMAAITGAIQRGAGRQWRRK